MSQGTTTAILEIILISVLNIIAVYIATFTYKLSWGGVASVMALAALLTAGMSHVILSKARASIKEHPEVLISESLAVLGTTLITSSSVLFILTRRFSLPEAIGIALTSGIVTTFTRRFLSG